MAEDAGSPSPVANPHEPISLNLLEVLDEVQGNHGVPIGDYSDYAAFCTRKLGRLRHKEPQLLSHAGKYAKVDAPTSTGKIRRHAFAPRILELDDPSKVSEVVLWSLFFQAERAWARAMIGEGENSHQNSLRKLNKASSWAVKMEQAAAVSCDPPTQQQCAGYAAWMKGNAALERHDYAEALVQYQTAVDAWITTSPERVETTLRPLLRYCQYEVGSEATVDRGTDSTEVAAPKIMLEFRGESVALDSYQQLAIAYLKIEATLKSDIREMDETAIEALLSDLEDALKLVPSKLQLVTDFLVFQKRKYWQVLQEGREESVALLRALQENAQAMVDMIDDEDDDDRLLAEAQVLRFRATACYLLAETFTSAAEQLTLLQHAEKLCESATEELQACQEDTTKVTQLADSIATAMCRAEATAVISQLSTDSAANGPLWLHMYEKGHSGPLVEPMPSYIPIMAKGVMFDLAWPHIAANTDGLQQVKKSSSWSWFS